MAAIFRVGANPPSSWNNRTIDSNPSRPAQTWWVSPTLLPDLADDAGPRPFRLDLPQPDLPVKRRIWPINGPLDIAMLDRVPPALPQRRGKIAFIADVMLPKPPLPNPRLALGDP